MAEMTFLDLPSEIQQLIVSAPQKIPFKICIDSDLLVSQSRLLAEPTPTSILRLICTNTLGGQALRIVVEKML
uniref:Uncharacterized protein n=1 Tax=Brassica campestris TaxID=3711 RepID=A0A3P5ZSR9_BRACM|nr:unnamed protein product [Brassica rapa]